MSRYAIARSAVSDLDEIWLYIARQSSIDIAERVIESITSVFPLLATNPEMGRLRPNLGGRIRSFVVDDYRIYYRSARPSVRILQVKHAARDEQRSLR